ncbi:MAG: tetratricopeptide repeat protein [Gammaproteobacteria bacterium]|nr:tetratricopeptide repeat protein [Gammaproteobacteria bacterium]
MYYTKPLSIILLLLIAGCSTSPSKQILKQGGDSTSISDTEISLYRQAITELSDNHLDKATTSFLKMSKTKPDLAGPWANLALIYIKKQQYEKANNAVKTALTNNPDMPHALNLAGVIAEQDGRIDDARGFYEKALTNKPDYAIAHYNLALLFDVYLQDIASALPHYQRYLALTGGKDKNTALWVKELKFNLENNGS